MSKLKCKNYLCLVMLVTLFSCSSTHLQKVENEAQNSLYDIYTMEFKDYCYAQANRYYPEYIIRPIKSSPSDMVKRESSNTNTANAIANKFYNSNEDINAYDRKKNYYQCIYSKLGKTDYFKKKLS